MEEKRLIAEFSDDTGSIQLLVQINKLDKGVVRDNKYALFLVKQIYLME